MIKTWILGRHHSKQKKQKKTKVLPRFELRFPDSKSELNHYTIGPQLLMAVNIYLLLRGEHNRATSEYILDTAAVLRNGGRAMQ